MPVLDYSRHMWVQIVFDQHTETWLRLHVEAFAASGGRVAPVKALTIASR